MISSDQRMIERQAQIISDLRREITSLHNQLETEKAVNAKNSRAAVFYFSLQTQILENPILQSEWDRFCSFLKMTQED
jgi:hypothetical protein